MGSQYLPPANEVWGKVMFLQVSVCPQEGGIQGVSIQVLESGGGPLSGSRRSPSGSGGGSSSGSGGGVSVGVRSTSGRYTSYWSDSCLPCIYTAAYENIDLNTTMICSYFENQSAYTTMLAILWWWSFWRNHKVHLYGHQFTYQRAMHEAK